MSVRAKFTCHSKSPRQNEDGEEVGDLTFGAVYASAEGVEGNACEENAIFGKWTPGAHLSMTIENPAAFAQFEQDKDYYVDFTPAT